MGSANVSVSFEATSADETAQVVAGWVINPGCTVLVSYSEMLPPGESNSDGAIVESAQPPSEEVA